MITLSLLTYIVISLLIARHRYNDLAFDRNYGQVNPCYQNGKKSLKYGFLCLPVLAVSIYISIMVVIGLCTIIVSVIGWILTNMP